MGGIKLKSYAYKYESKVLKKLSNQYEYCIRVPMSLMPFDILCIDRYKGIIAFIEVKYGKSELTENQRMFKEIIDSVDDWRAIYEVVRVEK